MLYQLTIGSVAIVLTLIIQVMFFVSASSFLNAHRKQLANPPFILKTSFALILVVLWIVFGITVSTWLWAVLFLLIGVFNELEPALYFSIVTFTSLGYGDITLDPSWRILGTFSAVSGLIVFGLNTAFIVEFVIRVRATQDLLPPRR